MYWTGFLSGSATESSNKRFQLSSAFFPLENIIPPSDEIEEFLYSHCPSKKEKRKTQNMRFKVAEKTYFQLGLYMIVLLSFSMSPVTFSGDLNL